MSARDDEITVLHVENDEGFAEITALFVERFDDRMSVVSATDAGEALEFLERLDVDCIVSEYALSDTDGIAFLQAVRERASAVPFVLFTTRESEMVTQAALTGGATAFLRKRTDPDQFEDLVQVIDHCVTTESSDEQQRSVDDRGIDAD